MEYRKFFNNMVATGVAYSHFAKQVTTPTPEKVTGFYMDEASTFPPRRGSDKSHTLPPKRRNENREQYRQRLRESGLIG